MPDSKDAQLSDGPHRSLNMRRGWKRLAERAANAAFDDNERRDALAGALQVGIPVQTDH
ncbi:MAG: hypothetical protein OXG04_13560 [Acidobacteria bacterium]|nr:hypothetical protein [Acidobacteriota bacterium]